MRFASRRADLTALTTSAKKVTLCLARDLVRCLSDDGSRRHDSRSDKQTGRLYLLVGCSNTTSIRKVRRMSLVIRDVTSYRGVPYVSGKLLKFPIRWRKFPGVYLRKIADA